MSVIGDMDFSSLGVPKVVPKDVPVPVVVQPVTSVETQEDVLVVVQPVQPVETQEDVPVVVQPVETQEDVPVVVQPVETQEDVPVVVETQEDILAGTQLDEAIIDELPESCRDVHGANPDIHIGNVSADVPVPTNLVSPKEKFWNPNPNPKTNRRSRGSQSSVADEPKPSGPIH